MNCSHDGDESIDIMEVSEVKEDLVILTSSEEARWLSKIIDGPNGCHIWTASKNRKGYGRFRIRRGLEQTHRLSYQIHKGPIPDGMCVCHRCDTPSCVNAEHLFLGTNEENVADRVAKGRTAKGERHGANTKPELHCRGDNHPARVRPLEVLKIGEENPWSKLTEDNVREIRRCYESGVETQTALAKRFGVSSMNISNICRRKKWARVV